MDNIGKKAIPELLFNEVNVLTTLATGRKAIPELLFNGVNVSTTLVEFLQTFSYTDVASGESDSIDIGLHNIGMEWLGAWYPTKGDKIQASICYKDWDAEGNNLNLVCGTFILDDIGFTGGPLTANFSALSIPANDAFKTTQRTATWKQVTIEEIAQKIADRYGLQLVYDADPHTIEALEQSEKTDSEFLFELCKSYGLAMKVFNERIIIFDEERYENKNTVATLTRSDFIDDSWDYKDTLEGTYTGAKISYTSGKDNEEIETYVGLDNAEIKTIKKVTGKAKTTMNVRNVPYIGGHIYGTIEDGGTVEVLEQLSNGWLKIEYSEASCGYAYTSNASEQYYTISEESKISIDGGSRCLNVNEKADSLKDAQIKAAAKVNEANKNTTTLNGTIWANPKIIATSNVEVKEMGKIDGKYAVDKVTTSIDENGTKMQIELRRIQERLKPPVEEAAPKKSYEVGDIVQFKGGTHYVSSYPDAKGYSVSAGPAKITIADGSGKAHPWHLITENWGETHVWGWVDDGTFE